MTEEEEIARLKEYFEYHPEIGEVVWKKSPPRKTIPYGAVAGTKDSYGYRVTKLFKKMYKVHRIAWVLYYGKFPTKFVDHINGIVDDNRIVNLRDVSFTENAHNKYTNRAGKLVGVAITKGKKFPYVAHMSISGESYNLGRYATEEAAHEMYMQVFTKLKDRGFDFNAFINKESFLAEYGDIITGIKYHPHQPIEDIEQPYLSIYKGVCLVRKCNSWLAEVWVDKKKYSSRYMPTELEAGIAYDIMSLYLRDDTPHLNFPLDNYKHLSLKEEFDKVTCKRKGVYTGVYRNKEGTWVSQLNVDTVHYHLGTFSTPIEAAIARDAKAFELLSSKAKLNFPKRVVDGVYNKEINHGQ